jgi:hypothetical protein
MLPPPLGQFGNMSRNMFQDTGFKNFDFSVGKSFHFGETMRLQFRAEFFNIFNHPNFANPYGGQNGFGLNDPSVRPFGCGCATPDIAAANPAVGSGGTALDSAGSEVRFLVRFTIGILKGRTVFPSGLFSSFGTSFQRWQPDEWGLRIMSN